MREALSKKIRFEVFKRDKFTCQYCGKSSPDVVLEVDHIVPVAEGGTNDIENLITACFDCNRGKGKRELTDDAVIKKQKKELDHLQERRENLQMMAEWRKELQNEYEHEIDYIEEIIRSYDSAWELSATGRRTVKKLIKQFGYEQVANAADIAFDSYFDGTENSWHKAFNKIGGICYNRKIGRGAEYYYGN